MLRPKCLQVCRSNRLPAHVLGAGASVHGVCLSVQASLYRKVVALNEEADQ